MLIIFSPFGGSLFSSAVLTSICFSDVYKLGSNFLLAYIWYIVVNQIGLVKLHKKMTPPHHTHRSQWLTATKVHFYHLLPAHHVQLGLYLILPPFLPQSDEQSLSGASAVAMTESFRFKYILRNDNHYFIWHGISSAKIGHVTMPGQQDKDS